MINHIVGEIRKYFSENGEDSKAIIGISGGKDSTVAAALLVKALGKDRVIGVLIPNGEQSDIDDAYRVCGFLDIKYHKVNIKNICDALYDEIGTGCFAEPKIFTNTPARIRMTVLYAIAALYPSARVICTGNASEKYVGYTTKYGDLAGDFAVLSNYYVSEIYKMGDELGLPYELVHKTPSDGMCGKSDEENMGITYEDIEKVAAEGTAADVDYSTYLAIDKRRRNNKHKQNIRIPAVSRPMEKGMTSF